ncbi:MAG: glycosyltransferase [Blastochloris sp.]|nr:glycosyltransferase [Blastochloris sp.]
MRISPPSNNVEFTGYLDDIRPAVAQAWAEIVPLRQGGGTRLKVLEALALGTPVVSTSKGIEGLDLKPDRDVLIANTPEEFAQQTLRLLASPTLRHELAEQGHRAALIYDWSHSVERLNELIATCVNPQRKTMTRIPPAVSPLQLTPITRSNADVEEVVQ